MTDSTDTPQLPVNMLPISAVTLKDHVIPAAYVLSHPSSGKRYIGSTGNLYNRIHLHKSRLKAGTHDNKPLQEAFNDDRCFNLSAIFTNDKESALDLEQILLDEGHKRGDLLNIAVDARRSASGKLASDSTRQMLSEYSRARAADPEYRTRLSDKMKEVMNSSELRSAQSERAKRQMTDPEHRAKMIAATSRPVTIDGVQYSSIKEAAAILGINRSTLASRLNRKKSVQ